MAVARFRNVATYNTSKVCPGSERRDSGENNCYIDDSTKCANYIVSLPVVETMRYT